MPFRKFTGVCEGQRASLDRSFPWRVTSRLTCWKLILVLSLSMLSNQNLGTLRPLLAGMASGGGAPLRISLKITKMVKRVPSMIQLTILRLSSRRGCLHRYVSLSKRHRPPWKKQRGRSLIGKMKVSQCLLMWCSTWGARVLSLTKTIKELVASTRQISSVALRSPLLSIQSPCPLWNVTP